MKQERPNLVFVFPDQFRQQAIGYMNQDPVVTPNLDRFASEGVVFTNAVSNYPVCSPYRAMLFTGKYEPVGLMGKLLSKTIGEGMIRSALKQNLERLKTYAETGRTV